MVSLSELFGLRAKDVRHAIVYTNCTACGVPLTPVWWQRIPMYAICLTFAFGLPELLGVWGIALIFAAAVFLYPAMILATFLLLKTVPTKYVCRNETVTTIFRR